LDSEELEEDYDNFQYLAGVGGDTGLGKTSLLNALLHPKGDIAPSSQAGACTAAVCCFRYHEPIDEDKKFRAVAHFKSKETVEKELAAFFKELKDFETHSTDEEARDTVYRSDVAKMKSQLQLIHAWSGLKVDRIRELGMSGQVTRITAECQGSSRFFNLESPNTSRTEEVHNAKAPKFLKLVKPYVGGARRKTQLLWPLVEIVHFYLNVDNVLRQNITLVDLPGEMDALESRSKVAHAYYQKLDQLMVVTPGDRAADNHTAMSLLREDQILDMEADGKSDSLCVVITKVDLMNWVSFVENEWSPEDVSDDFPALKAKYDMLASKVKQLGRRTKSHREEFPFDLDEESSTDVEDSGDELVMETPSCADPDTRESLERDLAAINAQCLRACIDARSRDSKLKFQDHFDMIRNAGREGEEAKVSTQLNVFPVSSHAHWCLAAGDSMPGFPDSEATGISPLEHWLVQGSLKKRANRSDRVLRQIRVLFDSIYAWVQRKNSFAAQLPDTEFPKIRAELGIYNASFQDVSQTFAGSSLNLR
jgi:predicted GTPase